MGWVFELIAIAELVLLGFILSRPKAEEDWRDAGRGLAGATEARRCSSCLAISLPPPAIASAGERASVLRYSPLSSGMQFVPLYQYQRPRERLRALPAVRGEARQERRRLFARRAWALSLRGFHCRVRRISPMYP